MSSLMAPWPSFSPSVDARVASARSRDGFDLVSPLQAVMARACMEGRSWPPGEGWVPVQDRERVERRPS